MPIEAQDIADALAAAGVRADDVLCVHAGLQTALGMAGERPADKVDTVLAGLEQAVTDGVLVLPTFTYSFTRGEDYDVERSPSTVGVIGERFRARPGVRRTADPLFSTAVRGAPGRRWEPLFAPGDVDCFGDDSVFALLREADAKLVFIGVGFGYCTYVHHVEQRLGVPYRYTKDFEGTVHAGGSATPVRARYFVRDLEADVETYFDPLGQALMDSGAMTRVTLPRGPAVLVTTAAAVEAETVRRVNQQPDFLLRRGHAAAAGTP